MAKTDDPLFDLQQKVAEQEKQITNLKEYQESFLHFMNSVNYFLHKKYPDEIEHWSGIRDWYNQICYKEEQDRKLRTQIADLKAQGYVVTLKSEHDEALEVLNHIRKKAQERQQKMYGSDEPQPGI